MLYLVPKAPTPVSGIQISDQTFSLSLKKLLWGTRKASFWAVEPDVPGGRILCISSNFFLEVVRRLAFLFLFFYFLFSFLFPFFPGVVGDTRGGRGC